MSNRNCHSCTTPLPLGTKQERDKINDIMLQYKINKYTLPGKIVNHKKTVRSPKEVIKGSYRIS